MSETGHAKNLAGFDEVISFVKAYGKAYNPSNASIGLTALQQLSSEARNSLSVLNAALPAYSNAVAAREAAFMPLNKLVTRIMNALKAINTSPQVDDNAKTLVRKIRGSRATPKMNAEEKIALAAGGNEIKEVSSSQLSYDSRLENFDKLIKLLSSISLYSPNEEDLKVTALISLLNDLTGKNAAVVTAAVPVSNARIVRNNILYKADTGLVETATAVKSYIKSLFGATSPQYKQVSKIILKAVKL